MLSYERTGSFHQRCLIFLHGFLGCKEDWLEIISKLRSDFCCVAFDLPSHGSSPNSEDLYEDLFMSIDSCKLSRPVLVGYSLGGRICLSLLQKRPESFSGGIFLSAHTGLQTNQQKENRYQQDEKWADLLINTSSSAFLREWYDQSVFSSLRQKPSLYHRLLKRRAFSNPEALQHVLLSMSLSKQPHFENFSYPAYFLHGEEDRKYAELYSTLPPLVKKDPISSSGHAIHVENPLECAQKMKQWLIEENPWKQ